MRGGSILPLRDKVKQSALISKNESYILNVYLDSKDQKEKPSVRARGHLYLDDGETFNYDKT